jgi:NTP pyrophosphatase (non-canonical NTP hydrolase)
MVLRLDDYQKIAHETADYPEGKVIDTKEGVEHYINYIYPALGLAEEAGEVAGKYAKAVRDNAGVIDEERKKEIVKELGDVLWFVSELCSSLGVSLSEVAQKNLDKLSSRKERGVIHGSGDNR